MNDPAAQGARAAAHRLTSAYGARLEADVEAALHARDSDHTPPDQYIDPVALAGLIVAAASLAWGVYRDLSSKHSTPPATDHITRRVRTTLRETRTLDNGAEQIVEITVEETLLALPPAESPSIETDA